MTDQIQFDLTHNGHRYVALLDGKEVGFADVDPIGADGLLIESRGRNPSAGRLRMYAAAYRQTGWLRFFN